MMILRHQNVVRVISRAQRNIIYNKKKFNCNNNNKNITTPIIIAGSNNSNNGYSYHTTTAVSKKTKAELGINRFDSMKSRKERLFGLRSEVVEDEIKFPTNLKNVSGVNKHNSAKVVDDGGILAGTGIKILEKNHFKPPKQDDMEILDRPIYKLYMLYNALEEELGWEQDLQNELAERQMHINRHKRLHSWFENNIVKKLTNHIMQDGKKVKAEKLLYKAITKLKYEHDKDFESVISEAIFNTTPEMEVRYMRLGAQRHPVPFPLNSKRKISLAMKWLVAAARNGNQNGFVNNFTNELLQASQNKGSAVKRCEEMHKLAFLGQPYAHFRW